VTVLTHRVPSEAEAPTAKYQVTAVVLVRPLSLAKSRLALGAEQRRTLALAFALDAIASLFGSPLAAAVFVVTADPDVRRRLQKASVRRTDDDWPGGQAAVLAGCLAAATEDRGYVVAQARRNGRLRAADARRVRKSAGQPCLRCDPILEGDWPLDPPRDAGTDASSYRGEGEGEGEGCVRSARRRACP